MLNTSQHYKYKHIRGLLAITAENDFDQFWHNFNIVTPTISAICFYKVNLNNFL